MAAIIEDEEVEVKIGQPITEDELMGLPDDGFLYELVDGRLDGQPCKSFFAGIITANIVGLLGLFSRGHAPDSFGDLAPDLCLEIISPSERRGQMARKVQEYFDGGAVQVWHVCPERQQVMVFTSPTEAQTLDADGVLDADGILPGFSCRVADLFVLE